MYSLYIPKYRDDPRSATLLTEELGSFMRLTGYSCDLLVSPGYLSTDDGTIAQFLEKLEEKLTAPGRRTVGLGLFYGTNGGDHTGGSPHSLLERHSALLASASRLEEIPLKVKASRDHRKMIFFLKVGRKAPKGRLDCGNKNAFLAAVTVKAVLIGSSNFSWNTYWNGGKAAPPKGEADLLLFTDEAYKEDVQRRLSGEKAPAPPMVLFVSLAGGKAPETYFKEILTDFLSHALN